MQTYVAGVVCDRDQRLGMVEFALLQPPVRHWNEQQSSRDNTSVLLYPTFKM
jgi:hypothetical protein